MNKIKLILVPANAGPKRNDPVPNLLRAPILFKCLHNNIVLKIENFPNLEKRQGHWKTTPSELLCLIEPIGPTYVQCFGLSNRTLTHNIIRYANIIVNS